MKPKDYINKKAQEEALKAFGATQLNNNQETSPYFVGEISADRKTIKDPTGKVYRLTFTGNPQKHELAQRLSNDTAYVDARKNKQINVDGSIKQARAAFKFFPSNDLINYYVANLDFSELFSNGGIIVVDFLRESKNLGYIPFSPVLEEYNDTTVITQINALFCNSGNDLLTYSIGVDRPTAFASLKIITVKYKNVKFSSTATPLLIKDDTIVYPLDFSSTETATYEYTYDNLLDLLGTSITRLDIFINTMTVTELALNPIKLNPNIFLYGFLMVNTAQNPSVSGPCTTGSFSKSYQIMFALDLIQEIIYPYIYSETQNTTLVQGSGFAQVYNLNGEPEPHLVPSQYCTGFLSVTPEGKQLLRPFGQGLPPSGQGYMVCTIDNAQKPSIIVGNQIRAGEGGAEIDTVEYFLVQPSINSNSLELVFSSTYLPDVDLFPMLNTPNTLDGSTSKYTLYDDETFDFSVEQEGPGTGSGENVTSNYLCIKKTSDNIYVGLKSLELGSSLRLDKLKLTFDVPMDSFTAYSNQSGYSLRVISSTKEIPLGSLFPATLHTSSFLFVGSANSYGTQNRWTGFFGNSSLIIDQNVFPANATAGQGDFIFS